MVPFRRVPPGGRPRASELARLQGLVAAQSNPTGGLQDASSFGILQIPTPPKWIWARLVRYVSTNQGTPNGWPECGWWEYDELKFDHCTGRIIDNVSMSAREQPNSHSPRFPAYCTDPNCTDIPEGTVVQLWKGRGDWWLFKPGYPCPALESGSGLSGESGAESGESGSGEIDSGGGEFISPACKPECRIPETLCLTVVCRATGATCVIPMPHVGGSVWRSNPQPYTCPGSVNPFVPEFGCLTFFGGDPDKLKFRITWGDGSSALATPCTYTDLDVPCTEPFYYERDVDYPAFQNGLPTTCACGPFPGPYPWKFILSACP